jgi:hypothetical protein
MECTHCSFYNDQLKPEIYFPIDLFSMPDFADHNFSSLGHVNIDAKQMGEMNKPDSMAGLHNKELQSQTHTYVMVHWYEIANHAIYAPVF